MSQISQYQEVRVRSQGRDHLRKKYSKVPDNAAETKHLEQYPYNLQNKYLTHDDLTRIFNLVGVQITVNDLRLYQQACVNSSYIHNGEDDPQALLRDAIPHLQREGYLQKKNDEDRLIPLQANSNERLEYLGDAVCGLSVAAYLYRRFPDEDEGFMTRLRTCLICGSKLGQFAEKLGLQNHVMISRYVETVNNGRRNHKVLEDIFESFIGAMFTDSGADFTICDKFFTAVVEKYTDFADLIANNTNFKDEILRYYQRHHEGSFPVYKEISVDVQDGVKVYHMGVLSPDGSQIIATGTSKRKRYAEQIASLEALKVLQVPGYDK